MTKSSLLFTTFAVGMFAQAADDPNLGIDRRLFAEVKNHNQVMANLSYLCDLIGPRLTVSANFDKAAHWTAQRMRDYGLQNVRLEPWTIPHSWTRGMAEAHMASPTERPISLASYGWALGTPGSVRGPVVYVNAKKPEDLEAYKGKLKGAIVVLYPPEEFEAPPHPMLTPYGDDVLSLNRAKPPLNFAVFNQLYRLLGAEGAAALLMQSDKQNGLLNTWAIGYLGEGGRYGTPDAYGSHPRHRHTLPGRITTSFGAYCGGDRWRLKSTFGMPIAKNRSRSTMCRARSKAVRSQTNWSSSAPTWTRGTWAPAPQTMAPALWPFWKRSAPSSRLG